MRPKHLDLFVTIILVILNIVWALLPNRPLIIGIVLALPLVFFLPGYTLAEVLFHKRTLDSMHRFLLNLGLTLVIDILSGFILNILPIGLRAVSWSVFVGFLTGMFVPVIAYNRRRSVVAEIRPKWHHLSWHEYLLFSLSLAVILLSLGYSARSVTLTPRPGFTELWMLPSTHADDSCAVRIGVRSFEITSTTYRIEMAVNGSPITAWQSVKLAPQQEWDQFVTIRSKATSSLYLEVQLYRSNNPEAVYRKVNITLAILKSNKDGSAQACQTS